MAIGTTLKTALREVAVSLTAYAKDHGWKNEDYWIYSRIESEWDRLHIIFVSKHFDPANEFSNYVLVREYLQLHFASNPEILDHLGLVVRSEKQVAQGGIYAIDPDFEEFWTVYRS